MDINELQMNNETEAIDEVRDMIIRSAKSITELENVKVHIAKLNTKDSKYYLDKVLPELMYLAIDIMALYTEIYRIFINNGLNPKYRDKVINNCNRANEKLVLFEATVATNRHYISKVEGSE